MALSTSHGAIDRAFRIALGDLYSSTVLYRSGLIEKPSPMIMAGLDYDDPWTRDAAINCWNGCSLLAPPIARNTLLGVIESKQGGPQIAGQYWDKIIWATGAWHHYLVAGDREFLSIAAQATLSTLRQLEEDEFDAEIGLFRGGACFQDGVAGYPDRYVRGHHSSGPITVWAEANPTDRSMPGAGLPMMAGSTNCLYYSAYRCAALMTAALGLKGSAILDEKARRLSESIVRHFWDDASAQFAYLIDPWEVCRHQEGLGLSFALLFGVLDGAQAERAIVAQHITPQGIPCVWPSFRRYRTPDGWGQGRHSGTVWPHVQGFWAEAVARQSRVDLLANEILALAGNATRDAQFTEIYHPDTGAIYGGRQEHTKEGAIGEWRSCRRQTWSATAFLRMMLHGVLGMRFDENGVSWEPCLPAGIGPVRLQGLPYRGAIFNIDLSGSGRRICSFTVNGVAQNEPRILGVCSGDQSLEIVVEP